MSQPFIAEIRMFAGNFAIRNWAFCDGQLLPISQNTALFSIIGTIYGGDGRSTTALPNLQTRVPLGPGRGPGLTDRRLGERGGAATETLIASQLPSHNHVASAQSAQADMDVPAVTNHLAATPGGTRAASIYGAAANMVDMAAESGGATGGSQAHDNEQPYTVVNFLIALNGEFPSRS